MASACIGAELRSVSTAFLTSDLLTVLFLTFLVILYDVISLLATDEEVVDCSDSLDSTTSDESVVLLVSSTTGASSIDSLIPSESISDNSLEILVLSTTGAEEFSV